MEKNPIPSIISKINMMDAKASNAGGYTYMNDRVPPDADEEHKKVLQTLIDLVKTDSAAGNFNGFVGLTYNDASNEGKSYDAGKGNADKLYGNISGKIVEALGNGYGNSDGRILVVNENVNIVYDSFSNTIDQAESKSTRLNTYANAGNNTINESIIGYRSYYMAANMSDTRIGHGIKRSGTSNKETVYVAHALGPYGYNDLTVIYAVSWADDASAPDFIKPWWINTDK